MDIDFSKMDESQLLAVKRFAEALVEFQDAGGDINFDDPDLAQADEQINRFIEERRAGRTGKAEVAGDEEARKSIREWRERTGRAARDSE